MEKLIKQAKKDMKLNRSKALVCINVVFGTVGNGYCDEDYLTYLETDNHGYEGFQAKLEFKKPKNLKNLINEIF